MSELAVQNHRRQEQSSTYIWGVQAARDPAVRVLYVDPSGSNQEMIEALRRAGYAVHVAATHDDGLAHCIQQRPHLVVLEADHHWLSCMATLERVRWQFHLPVIVRSQRADKETVAQTLERGADDYLSHRVSGRIAAARITTVLRRIGSAESHTRP